MEESLAELLEIIKIDKNWEDKKANKFMLALFKELGNSSPLTQKYRKLMQRLLYWINKLRNNFFSILKLKWSVFNSLSVLMDKFLLLLTAKWMKKIDKKNSNQAFFY